MAMTQGLRGQEETPRHSCVPIGLGLDSRRKTYEHMGGADHVVVNGPSNVRAEAIVEGFCAEFLANLSSHLRGQFAVSVGGRDSSAQPAVDLGKYKKNIVSCQMGNGKKKRCWPARFATTMSDSHLAQKHSPSRYLYGECPWSSKQACWVFVWYSEVMMSPGRFASRFV